MDYQRARVDVYEMPLSELLLASQSTTEMDRYLSLTGVGGSFWCNLCRFFAQLAIFSCRILTTHSTRLARKTKRQHNQTTSLVANERWMKVRALTTIPSHPR